MPFDIGNDGVKKHPGYRAVVGLLFLTLPSGLAKATSPSEALDREWLVSSLLQGSRLANRNLFDIAFEKKRGPGKTTGVWIASSDGLHFYDGYQWRRFGKADGLPSDFVRSVLLTRDGKLWVGTAEGAGVFDGKSFSRNGSERGLAGPSVRRIVEDVNGTLWFCSDSWPRATGAGGLASYRNGQWRSWHQKEGLPSDYVVNFFRSSKGEQFVLTAAGLAELRGERWAALLSNMVKPGVNWGAASMTESPRFGMMVSTGTDVFVRKDGQWRFFTDTMRHEHGIIATADGSIVACGSKGPHQKFFVEWTGDHWKPVSAAFPVTHDFVENLREAPDGSIYTVGFDCLRRWERGGSEWHAYVGTPKPLFTDRHGAVWSMDQRGFFIYRANHWIDLGTPFRGLLPDATGVWAWNAHYLVHWLESTAIVRTPSTTAIFSYESVTLDRQGNVWALGRDKGGRERLLRFDGTTWTEIQIPEASWMIGTPDPVAGMWYLIHHASGNIELLRITDECTTYPVPSKVISQYVNSIHADEHGNVWLFGDTGLHRWRKEHASSWETISGLPGTNVTTCLEHAGELWFVVDGSLGGSSGLVSFSHGKWKTYEADPISSWSVAERGQLLLGSKGKFYVIPIDGDRSPIAVKLPEPEQVIGILEDGNHTYWLGTPHGTFLFHPAKNPPDTALVSYDQQVIEGARYRGRVRGIQSFRPATPAADFSYAWSFDDGPWSAFDPTAERSFATSSLGLGTHSLRVRARDNSMGLDPTPVAVKFQIHDLPLQERAWFVPALVCLAILMAGLTLVAGAARYKLVRQAEHLEEMVEARTLELKVREEQLRRSNRTLLRTNEDLRQFSWAASHDLQEPLRMVVTYTQFLAKRYEAKLDDTGKEFIAYAVEGAHRVHMLLQALLEYWQIGEANDDPAREIAASAALKKALDHLAMILTETGAVVSFSEMPTVHVSETALVQLFQNLLSNAIKYRNPELAPRIEVSAQRANDLEWQFSVEDNGIGIASEHRELIFKLFKRLNGNRYAGTGIGLALCAKIVENVGGRMWVESEVGRGSTFHFTIPA